MQSKRISAQSAMDEAAEIYKELGNTALSHKGKIKSFGSENDTAIRSYIHGLEQWVCGHAPWYLESRRYYGEKVEEVKKSGKVRLKGYLNAALKQIN